MTSDRDGQPAEAARSVRPGAVAGLHQAQVPQKGKLKTMIERDGLKGVTSNPSIFEKAIGEGDEYDRRHQGVAGRGRPGRADIYETLAIADIQHAADVLRPVYDATKAWTAMSSLEVSPYLAYDTEATVAEARRLWKRSAGQPDGEGPGTSEGMPAIRR